MRFVANDLNATRVGVRAVGPRPGSSPDRTLGEPATYNGGRTVSRMETTAETRDVAGSVGAFTIPAVNPGGISAGGFGRVLQHVAAIASEDSARGVMAGVQIRAAGENVTFTATDSYRAISVTVRAGVPVGEWVTVIERETAARVGGEWWKNRNSDLNVAGVVGRPWIVSYGFGSSPVRSEIATMGQYQNVETFPKIDAIIVKNETEQIGGNRWPGIETEIVAVNPDLLGDLLGTVRKIQGGKRSDVFNVKIHNMSGRQPWRLTAAADHVQITAVIMPVRC